MHQAQDFKGLFGLSGFSEALLTNHFALYEGYVKNVNALEEKIDALQTADQMATPEYAELKRRFGWEWNGMRLHELYFSNLTKNQTHTEESALHQAVVKQWGSVEAWEKDFRATGAMRGIGWVILTYDFCSEGKLVNVWINEHDAGHLAGTLPILVMDVFEHAFALDYGIKRADYIEAFWKAIWWEKASERFDLALRLQDVMVRK